MRAEGIEISVVANLVLVFVAPTHTGPADVPYLAMELQYIDRTHQ